MILIIQTMVVTIWVELFIFHPLSMLISRIQKLGICTVWLHVDVDSSFEKLEFLLKPATGTTGPYG